MSKEIKSFEIIKKMYKYFVKKYRDLEPKLMICEKEDFDTIEKSLKALEIIKEVLPINEDDFYEENGKCYFIGNEVDKDTFELLKEVLL